MNPFKAAGTSVQWTTGSQGVRISGRSAEYTMFWVSVKSTGYPLHSPVPLHFPSRMSLCAITFQLESTMFFNTLPCNSTILILLTEIFITNWFHFLFKCIHISLYMVFCFFRQFTIMCIQQISFYYLWGPFNFSYIYSVLSWLECDIMCSLHKTSAVLVLPLYQ